jgi:hypothetical protein
MSVETTSFSAGQETGTESLSDEEVSALLGKLLADENEQ